LGQLGFLGLRLDPSPVRVHEVKGGGRGRQIHSWLQGGDVGHGAVVRRPDNGIAQLSRRFVALCQSLAVLRMLLYRNIGIPIEVRDY